MTRWSLHIQRFTKVGTWDRRGLTVSVAALVRQRVEIRVEDQVGGPAAPAGAYAALLIAPGSCWGFGTEDT